MRSLLRSDLLLRRRDHRTLSSLAGSIPVPLALGADFEHCVVQLGGFELVCERYIRDRDLIETPQGLADLYRFEGRSHSIKHSERRADENQAGKSKQLLLREREDGRPILFGIQSTSPHFDGA